MGDSHSELLTVVAQLRHAYAHLAAGTVKNQKKFADGLISPAIRALESGAPAQSPIRSALERVLLDIDLMVERGVIPDIRDDIIYVEARSALSSAQ